MQVCFNHEEGEGAALQLTEARDGGDGQTKPGVSLRKGTLRNLACGMWEQAVKPHSPPTLLSIWKRNTEGPWPHIMWWFTRKNKNVPL